MDDAQPTAAPYERNVHTAPFLDLAQQGAPGFGRVRNEDATESHVKWMGGDHDTGPWIYWVQRPAGHVIPPHKHKAGRVEFIARGAIEWFEGREAVEWFRHGPNAEDAPTGRRYSQGSLTWMPAGTVYGYRILEDTDVLLWFDGPPGGTDWAL